MPVTEKYKTVAEVAETLQVSQEHVRRLFRRGKFHGARKMSTARNADIRIPPRALETYIKSLPVGGF